MLPAAAFRRSRWERVADPSLVDELEAEHAALDPAEQIEASAHVDEVSDDDLRDELACRQPPAETPPDAGADGKPAKRGRAAPEAAAGGQTPDPT